MAAEEDSTIEQAAVARRERLKALREAQELLSKPEDDNSAPNHVADDDEDNEEESHQQKKLNMKFRNYLPHDKELQEGKLEAPVLPKFEDPIAAAAAPTEKIEDPFLNIAPKKPNWDLRRDVQKKLDKLERRTQKVIVQIMEEQEKGRLAIEEANGQTAED